MRLLLLAALLAIPLASAQGPLLPTAHVAVCFRDDDADGASGSQDPIYLQVQACGTGTAPGDARLTSSGPYPGGTLVNGSHDDTGRPTLPLGAGYGYLDDNGDGSYSANEPIVLHVGALPGTMAPGDLRLSGPQAFQRLAGDDELIGRPVLAAPVAVGGESYAERDGSTGFTTGDYLLLDMDGNGLTTLGDLRLAVPHVPPVPSSSPPMTSSGSSTVPTGPPESTSSQDAPSGSDSPDLDTPGLGLAALIVILVALARRHA